MPVTVVVGGQYGSEGKGKVAHWLARQHQPRYAIRVGGPNSGHTVVDTGRRIVLRHLPTPILHDEVIGIVPAGAYLDLDLLLREIEDTGLTKDRLLIHPSAVVLDESMRAEERAAGLLEEIASTGQGVGGAVAQRAMRRSSISFARTIDRLREFVCPDLDHLLAVALKDGQRVMIEGTQGFGLSLLYGNYPYTTSRETTAAGALSEAGLSPRDVDCIALVIRTFPIRVSGNSGPLPLETTWETIGRSCAANIDLTEYTTVTGRPRRVAKFHDGVVSRAIRTNRPDLIFLNHVDYFDYTIHEDSIVTPLAARNIAQIESQLGMNVDYVGTGPSCIIDRPVHGWYIRKVPPQDEPESPT